jgi:hypothetical protein
MDGTVFVMPTKSLPRAKAGVGIHDFCPAVRSKVVYGGPPPHER